MRSSWSTPAGIFTDSVLCFLMRPAPWQVAHGSVTTLPRAVAVRAGLLDREEALRHAHFAAAVAGRAVLRLRAGLGAACRGRSRIPPASGCGSSSRCRAPPPRARARGCSAGRRRGRRRCRGRRAAAPKISPKMSPNASAKPPKPSAPRAARRSPADGSTPAWPNWSYARALLRIGEDLVGLLRFLEFLLGRLVVRIAVRMVLHRELAIGLLDVLVGGVAVDAEHL